MKDGKMRVGGGTTGSKKLLATMAILAVAFVILAAVPVVSTDSDATSAPVKPTSVTATELSVSDGKVTLSSSQVAFTVSSQITSAVEFELNGITSAIVWIERSSLNTSVFNGGTIIVPSGVTLVINETISDSGNKNFFVNASLQINGGTVFFEQGANKGQIFYGGSIVMNGGNLVMHSNGMSPSKITMSDGAQIKWESISDSSESWKVINALPSISLAGTDDSSIGSGCSIDICDGARIQLQNNGNLQVEGILNANYQDIQNSATGKLIVKDGGVFNGTIFTKKYGGTDAAYISATIRGSGNGVSVDQDASNNLVISGEVKGVNSIRQSTVKNLNGGSGWADKLLTTGGLTIASGGKLTVGNGTTLTVAPQTTHSMMTVNGELILDGSTLVFSNPVTVGQNVYFSFLNGGEGGKITMDDATLEMKNLGWAYSTATSTPASVKMRSSGVVAMTFDKGFTQGSIDDVTISGAGSIAVAEGAYPVIAGKTLDLQVPVTSGEIVLFKDGSSKASIEISDRGSYTGTISQATQDSGTLVVTKHVTVDVQGLKAASGKTLNIAAGSIVITGELDAATVTSRIASVASSSSGSEEIILKDLTVTGGELKIQTPVSVEGKLTVSSGSTLSAESATVTVTTGSTVAIAKNASVVSFGTGELVVSSSAKVDVSGTLSATTQNSGTIAVSSTGSASSSSISGSGTVTVEQSFIPVPKPDDDPVVIVPDSTGSDSDDGKDAKVLACAAAACVVVILAAFILVDTRHR